MRDHEILLSPMKIARLTIWVLATTLLGCAVEYRPQRAPSASTLQLKAAQASPQSDVATIQPLTVAMGELWIIEKPAHTPAAITNPQWAAGPTLTTQARGKTQQCSLSHVDVQARVIGSIATVDVSQHFENPASEPAEATYSFPLPASATITDLAITIGARHIRAIIRERKEAEQIYRQASRQGYLVSLLSETAPNVFTQSIGNIAPRQAVQIRTQYIHRLSYENGWFAFRFPLVCAFQNLHLHQPGELGGRLTLSVSLEPGFAMEKVECPTHRMEINLIDGFHAIATLERGQALSRQELVLRFKPARKGIGTSLFASRDATGEGGFVALTLVPPADTTALPRRPIDAILISNVDAKAKDKAVPVIRRVLEKLHDDDRFVLPGIWPQPVFPETAVAPTAENRSRAMEAFAQLPRVQTDILARLQAAPAVPTPLRARIVFLVTDGKADLRPILERLSDMPIIQRIVVLALEEGPHISEAAALAYRSGGALVRLSPPHRLELAIDNLMDSISRPALVEPRVVWKGAQVSDVLPRAQDLLVGHPLLITGRFKGPAPTEAVVEDQRGDSIVIRDMTLAVDHSSPSLAAAWARMRMTQDALERNPANAAPADKRIRDLAMEFGLVSPFTSYVCVDAKAPTVP